MRLRRAVLPAEFALAGALACRPEPGQAPETAPAPEVVPGDRTGPPEPARPPGPGPDCPQVPETVVVETPAAACAGDVRTCDAACRAGDDSACLASALALSPSRRSIELLRGLCTRGHLEACFRLASVHDHGVPFEFPDGELVTWGVEPDRACAIHLYEDSCTRGHLKSCSNLGVRLTGEGPWRDDRRGAELLARTCTAGLSVACVNLGWCYKHGTGVAKDEAHSVSLFGGACDSGDYAGCLNLAHMVEQGQGGPRDLGRAAALYRQACELGGSSACGDLGRMTEAGEGVAHDLAEATRLYRKACREGHPYGCLQLDRLGAKR